MSQVEIFVYSVCHARETKGEALVVDDRVVTIKAVCSIEMPYGHA